MTGDPSRLLPFVERFDYLHPSQMPHQGAKRTRLPDIRDTTPAGLLPERVGRKTQMCPREVY